MRHIFPARYGAIIAAVLLFCVVASSYLVVQRKEVSYELTEEMGLEFLKEVLIDDECREEGAQGGYQSCTLEFYTGDAGWVVRMTYDGLYDDSIQAERFEADVLFKNGTWVAGPIHKTHQCREGRGSQDFTDELCS